MPSIDKTITIEVKLERFLDACSPSELREIDMLIQSPRYQNKMKQSGGPLINIDDINRATFLHHESLNEPFNKDNSKDQI